MYLYGSRTFFPYKVSSTVLTGASRCFFAGEGVSSEAACVDAVEKKKRMKESDSTAVFIVFLSQGLGLQQDYLPDNMLKADGNLLIQKTAPGM